MNMRPRNHSNATNMRPRNHSNAMSLSASQIIYRIRLSIQSSQCCWIGEQIDIFVCDVTTMDVMTVCMQQLDAVYIMHMS